MEKCVITGASYDIGSRGAGGRKSTSVNSVNFHLFVIEAGVESSMSPVGLGVDSNIRMLAGGCRWGSLGGLPPLHPPSPGGGWRINIIQL